MIPERYIGVDGCRAGWFAVAIGSDDEYTIGLHASAIALWDSYRQAKAILIDIPIGLISKTSAGRMVDAVARAVLKPRRHNSVFSPPCREALSAKTYKQACRINSRVCGRKISIQTWNISAKIKEVDDFLRTTPAAQGILRETHPEICFWAMAGYTPMNHPKKSAAGQNERLNLLQQIYPQSREIYQAALERFPRKEVAQDDIFDALANAVTATRLNEAGATLPQDPPQDRQGLPMEMVYARPAPRS